MKSSLVCLFLLAILFSGIKPSLAYQDFEMKVGDTWAYGSADPNDSNYWNLQIVGEKYVFEAFSDVCVLSKVYDIFDKHRWRTKIYRGEIEVLSDESIWHDASAGWNFSTIYPTLKRAYPGKYKAVTWLDTGSGFVLMGERQFEVLGESFYPQPTQIGTGWGFGATKNTDPAYWDLQIVNPANLFLKGTKICALGKAKDVTVKHRWITVFKFVGRPDYVFAPEEWLEAEVGWGYSTTYPVLDPSHYVGPIEIKTYFEAFGKAPYLVDTIKVEIVEKMPEPEKDNLAPIYHLLLGQ